MADFTTTSNSYQHHHQPLANNNQYPVNPVNPVNYPVNSPVNSPVNNQLSTSSQSQSYPYQRKQVQQQPQQNQPPQPRQPQSQQQQQQQQPPTTTLTPNRPTTPKNNHKSSRFSFGLFGKRIIEDSDKKQKRMSTTTKANPNAAILESEPVDAMLEKSTINSLFGQQFLDKDGNRITDPDRSNPTRPRLERPLDTINGFALAAEKSRDQRMSMPLPSSVGISTMAQSQRNSFIGTAADRRYTAASSREELNSNQYGTPPLRQHHSRTNTGAPMSSFANHNHHSNYNYALPPPPLPPTHANVEITLSRSKDTLITGASSSSDNWNPSTAPTSADESSSFEQRTAITNNPRSGYNTQKNTSRANDGDSSSYGNYDGGYYDEDDLQIAPRQSHNQYSYASLPTNKSYSSLTAPPPPPAHSQQQQQQQHQLQQPLSYPAYPQYPVLPRAHSPATTPSPIFPQHQYQSQHQLYQTNWSSSSPQNAHPPGLPARDSTTAYQPASNPLQQIPNGYESQAQAQPKAQPPPVVNNRLSIKSTAADIKQSWFKRKTFGRSK